MVEAVLGAQTYILAGVVVALVLVAGVLLGRAVAGKRYQAETQGYERRMFTIERALKAFWDDEREKFLKREQELKDRLALVEKQNEEYRKKVAGIGVFGKGKRADILMALMMENEALEEKLFEQNLKLKLERDEYLDKELQNITYKRVLLSEILSESKIRTEVEAFIRNNKKLKRVELKPLPGRLSEPEEEPAAARD